MTKEEFEKEKKAIQALGQFEMAELWRYAPVGHKYFTDPLFDVFKNEFNKKGGFTPAISKAL